MTYPNRENDFLSFPIIFILELLSIPDVFRIIMLFFPAVYPKYFLCDIFTFCWLTIA